METKCQTIQERMAPYLEDELGEAQRIELERHVGGCEQCLWRLEALRASAAREEEASAAAEAGENAAGARGPRVSWARRLWPAAAAVLIALALHFVMPEEADRPGPPEEAPSPPRFGQHAADPLDQELRAPVAPTAEASVFSHDPSDTEASVACFAEQLGLHVSEAGDVLEGPAPGVRELISRVEGLGCRVEIEEPAEGLPQEGWVRIALSFKPSE